MTVTKSQGVAGKRSRARIVLAATVNDGDVGNPPSNYDRLLDFSRALAREVATGSPGSVLLEKVSEMNRLPDLQR